MVPIHWTTTTANGHFFEKVIVNHSSFELCLALDPNCPIAAAASLGVASKNPTEGPDKNAGQQENSAI